MNLFIRSLPLLAMPALVVVNSGCSKAPAGTPDAGPGEATAQPAPWHFIEGRGIRLSEAGEKNIGLELAEVGFAPIESFVTASGRVFASGDDSAEITFHLPAGKAEALAPAARLTAAQDGASIKFEGQVTRIEKTPERAHGPVELIARIHNPEGRLQPGAFLDCRIQTESPGEAVIPKSSVLTTARGDFVYVQNGAYLMLTPVTLGGQGEEQVAVLEGLFEGDVVAAAGIESLWLTELQAINGGVACTHGH